jgi:hypothetical protein
VRTAKLVGSWALLFQLIEFLITPKIGITIMANSTKGIASSEDRNGWRWGFTLQTESWNGRLAMLGFASALLIEVLSGQGVLHFWNIL